MSCIFLSDTHYTFIANALQKIFTDNGQSLDIQEAGQFMLNTNQAAYNVRYNLNSAPELFVIDTRVTEQIELIPLYKLIQSLMYQCSELPDWETSPEYERMNLWRMIVWVAILNEPQHKELRPTLQTQKEFDKWIASTPQYDAAAWSL